MGCRGIPCTTPVLDGPVLTPRKGKEMEILFALVFMVRFGGVLVKIHASLVVGGRRDGEQIRFH
jgi:hypothetical protein